MNRGAGRRSVRRRNPPLSDPWFRAAGSERWVTASGEPAALSRAHWWPKTTLQQQLNRRPLRPPAILHVSIATRPIASGVRVLRHERMLERNAERPV